MEFQVMFAIQYHLYFVHHEKTKSVKGGKMHTGFSTILLFQSLFIRTAFSTIQCSPCTCCINGFSRCSNYHNCLDGCIYGYYGEKCRNACPINCLTCLDYNTCTSCKYGYYGQTCKCSAACQTCSTHYCSACIDGYYGDSCEKKCLEKCLSCNQESSCISCKDGFYNYIWLYDCRLECKSNCKACSSYGVCTSCIDGKYNGWPYDIVSSPRLYDCSLDCKRECVSCTSYYKCDTCTGGRYNNRHSDCRESCQASCATCESWSNCTECKIGRYGPSCQFNCGRGCIGNQCNKITGTCTCLPNYQGSTCDKCMFGHYGSRCELKCKGCERDNCNVDGICLNGCKMGFTGAKCDKCEAGKYGLSCTGQCPTNCEVCNTAENCTVCKQSFFGQTCHYQCPSSCKTCTSDIQCNRCKPGFYGLTCSDRCATHCQNELCYQDNGTCMSCNAGFYGIKCEIPCPFNCANNICDSFGRCELCKMGYYGSICTTKCPANCRDGKCNKENGMCDSCVDGYFSSTCNVPCSPNCKQGSPCGQHDGICTECASGLLSYYCSYPCSNNCKECKRYNPGICTTCEDGQYGIVGRMYLDCLHSCSHNCLNTTCNDTTGACVYGCIDGFWDNNCRSVCPQNCWNKQCFIQNGTCVDGCIAGYDGWNCQCPNNCQCNATGSCINCKDDFENTNRSCKCSTSLCLDSACSKCSSSIFYAEKGACCPCSKTCKNAECTSSSRCLSGCEAGYRGDDCSLKCNDIEPLCAECSTNFSTTSGVCLKCDVGCYPNEASNRCVTCPQNCANAVCNQANGMCTQGCTGGRWGEKCDKNCPFDCNQCQQTTGKCLTCNDGKFLSNCTERCSEHCNFTKEGVGICSIESGECLYGCSSFSKYGTYCENNCNRNCVSQICDWKTGHCLSGCDPGFYGDSCENQCSKRCSKVEMGSRQCNKSNGYCFGGCIKGWYGALCDQKCGIACINNTCDRISGNCFFGCTGGYKEPKCLQALEGSHDDRSKTGVTLGLTAGIVSVVLIIFGIIIVCYIRKRRNSKAKDKGYIIDDNRAGSSAIAFSELRAGEREIEQNDAVYARPSKPKKREVEESILTRNSNSNVAAAHVTYTECQQEQNDAVYARPDKLKKNGVDESIAKHETISVAAINVICSETKSDNNKHLKETVIHSDTDSGNNNVYDEIPLFSDDNNSCERTMPIKPPIKAKSAVNFKNATLKSPASKHSESIYNTRRSANSVLEIEEDLSNLTAFARNTTQLQEDAVAYETVGDNAYYNVAAMIKRKVPLHKLAEYVSELTREDFEEEFDKLPPGLIKPYTESQKKENLTKNRYKGIYPYDKTRVILTGGSDYINASFIDGYKKIKAYIASIGPTLKYMEDMSPFWRMVWQEKVGKIVMLTNLSEAGEPKCDQYWPRKDCSELFSDIQVTSDREDVYADYTIRSFTLQKDSEARRIVHAHFTAWPDKGTPDDVTSLIEFRQKVNSLCTDLDGPVVVHCSAGVGRTGTYISIDSQTQEGEAKDAVDIYACVRNLREHRVNMVQTAGQYQYLHKALVHILTFDCKPVKASNFHKYISTHTTEHLGNQFQHLQDSIKARTVDETEAVRLNKRLTEKNRQGADIPGDINRPRLHLQRQNGMAAYINALFINSFRTKKRFLIAQSPLPSTVEDFLYLIVQEHVSYIVSMEPNGNKAVGAYYPVDNKPLKVGSCTVTSEKAECTDHYIQRTLKILHQGKSKTQEVTVTHIQFTKWNENQKTPENPKMFMRFVRDVEIKCDSNDKERPILVHCLTGAEKSGLFCVVSILLEKIQLEQEISVVNTVRQVKNRRHMSIPNKEQYIFCHKCLDEYLRTFDTYSNFSLET